MRRICLTGGIASGKSTAARLMAELGAHTENADQLAREMTAIPAVRQALTDALGRSFYAADGTLKRAELAAYVFHHPEALKKVNDLIHPRVIAELEARYEKVKDEPGCFVVETALAVETGYVDWFDIAVVVTASRTERLRRLVDRMELTPDQAVARMAAQLPDEAKLERADHVITNDGTYEELEAQVRKLFAEICP